MFSFSFSSLQVNDELAWLPLEISDKLKVSRSGRRALVKTAAGITVTFNWRSTVRVTLPSTYQDAVCGLCGNYNGKRQDDMTMANGQSATNSNAFGESWQVGVTPGCSSACKGPRCQECSDKQKSKYKGSSYCGVIADKAGPFKNCHKQLDPETYLADCAFDACQYHGHFGAICDAVQTYASACQSEGITVDTWRRLDFCRESHLILVSYLCLAENVAKCSPCPSPLIHSNGVSGQQPLYSVRFGLSTNLCQPSLR